ncbi:MAG: glycoside hydrolase family 88 protein [Clostridiales bacterium]|nr:glycoside hydrolase family 88 protein [Clostridiales bacterium]
MRSKYTPLTDEQALAALDRCVRQVRCNLPLYTHRCQNHTSVDGIYPSCDNVQWTCGFWPGEIWLAYERTGEDRFREAGLALVDSFYDRIVGKIEVDHHDMGFLYSPSCVAAWRLTGSEKAREAALLAADQLLTRFQPRGEFFQAWGPMGAAENRRFIIDCLLNIPLLYWASQETGDREYADLAGRHAQTCLAHSFRPDGSTYHTFFMNADGTPSHGETCQGYRDDSFWARGQAWGVYGSILSFRYTKDPAYLATFRKALRFYLTRLPEDRVPYWDMIFSDGSDEPRDSSAAAIVVCGLLEARRWLPAGEAARCETLAREMLGSLAQGYAVPEITPGTGLLLHGTYSKKSPYNTCTPEGVDECTGWGDYFYLEALTRLTRDWYPYW